MADNLTSEQSQQADDIMNYQTKAGAAMAKLWKEWQPELQQIIGSMGANYRLMIGPLMGLLDIDTFIHNLDENPDTLIKLREYTAKLLIALEADKNGS